MRRRVAITQPYIPGYRERLWVLVIAELREAGIESRVFYGGDREQEREIRARGDGIEPAWASRIESWTVQPVASIPKFVFRRLPRHWRGREVLLVTEMQGTNLNAWLRAFSGQPYVTLGHGISETTTQSTLADAVENLINARATRVLTYTETGRQHVIASSRRSPEHVTAFRNSTDTTRLQRAMAQVSPMAELEFRERHGIPDNARVLLFLGALNRYKNVDLLVDASRVAFQKDPNLWLVVAGDGESRDSVRALAEESGRVVMLGQASPEQYAPAASMAQLLINPGRIGLVAVDALVMGLPLLTTMEAAHAPEHEYLRPGIDVIEARGTPAAFGAAMVEGAPTRVESIGHPTIEAAATAITMTIIDALDRRDR